VSITASDIPRYQAGTWTIDPVHSEVSFVVRHMMVSKVRGRFDKFEGTIVTAPDPLESSVTAKIDLASFNTGNTDRDNHVKSADFLDVENHPTMSYRSTGVRADSDGLILNGELTLKGVTRPVPLRLEVNGFGPDPYGGTRAGFSATGEIDRTDFGVTFNGVIPGSGGVILSDKITINVETEAVLDKSG
jgi:polyisoprenoid-binding protein YceI